MCNRSIKLLHHRFLGSYEIKVICVNMFDNFSLLYFSVVNMDVGCMFPLGSPTIVPFAYRTHTHALGKQFVLQILFLPYSTGTVRFGLLKEPNRAMHVNVNDFANEKFL